MACASDCGGGGGVRTDGGAGVIASVAAGCCCCVHNVITRSVHVNECRLAAQPSLGKVHYVVYH